MRKVRFVHRTLREEDGSAMTEFVIGLPVFILLFVGILSMHSLGLGAVLVKGRAHAKMWQQAIPIQTGFAPDWSMNPITAAGEAAVFHNATDGSALDYALDSASGISAVTGISGGIMAESYIRVKPADIVENIGVANEKVTWNINEDYIIMNEDSVTHDLMQDALNFGAFSGVDGPLSALNGVLGALGARPAIAGGVRYGISGDYQVDTVKIFGGQSTELEARSHVANAPRPTSRYITFAVVRLAMAKEDRYDTAIAFTLLPSFEGMGESSPETQQIEEFQACEAANENLGPDEEPADCGELPEIDGSEAEDAADDLWNNIDCRGSWCE